MTNEQIIEILNTRLKIAEKNGNTTEQSLIFELLKMAKENETLKKDKQI